MGWLFSNAFRNTTDIKNELNRQRGNLKIVDQKMTSYGRHIWTLFETPTGERFINLDLCEYNNDYGWGYKDMDESVGPCYYDCPMSLIEKAGKTLHHTAQTWRDAVEAHHQKASRKLKEGMTIRLYGNTYTVLEAGRQKIVRREDGRIFKLNRKNVGQLEIVG